MRVLPAILPCGCRFMPFTAAQCPAAERLTAACEAAQGNAEFRAALVRWVRHVRGMEQEAE